MRSLVPFAVVLSLTAQDPAVSPPVPDLPAAAMLGAERGPLALALVLAGSGIPAGLITTDEPDRAPGIPVVSPGSPAIEGGTVARQLVARHPAYAVEWRRGVMGIEPTQSVCGERLARTTVGPVTVEGHAGQLLVLLGWIASGQSPPVHKGVASRITGGPSEPAPPAPARSLRLVLTTTMTLRETLDQLVRENAGGVWIVWQHPRQEGTVGCRLIGYLPDGMVASNSDFAVVP